MGVMFATYVYGLWRPKEMPGIFDWVSQANLELEDMARLDSQFALGICLLGLE